MYVFLLFIEFKFLKKNGVSEKIKTNLPQHSPALQQLFSPHFFNFLQKTVSPTPIKEGRDYAFYMRVYKGEAIRYYHSI